LAATTFIFFTPWFGLCPSVTFLSSSPQVLQALTSSACQEALSYERAELLGDGFLKYAVSRRLFLLYPTRHEGQLTGLRQKIVSNNSLYKLALGKGLEGLVQADLFNPSKWAAPGLPRSGLVEREGLGVSKEVTGVSKEGSGRSKEAPGVSGKGETPRSGGSGGAAARGLGEEPRDSTRQLSTVAKEDEGGVRDVDDEERDEGVGSAAGMQSGGGGEESAAEKQVLRTQDDSSDAQPLSVAEFPPLGVESPSQAPRPKMAPIRNVRPLTIGKSLEGLASPGSLKGGDKLGRLVIEKAVPSPASVLAVGALEESGNEEVTGGSGEATPPGSDSGAAAAGFGVSSKPLDALGPGRPTVSGKDGNDQAVCVNGTSRETRLQPHARALQTEALEGHKAVAKPEQVSPKPKTVDSDGRPEEEVSESGFGPTDWRVVSDKGLADVVEALIGTYHAEGGVAAALGFMEWVGIENQVRLWSGRRQQRSMVQEIFLSIGC
jgi:dsRNA-specific ribonuclease